MKLYSNHNGSCHYFEANGIPCATAWKIKENGARSWYVRLLPSLTVSKHLTFEDARQHVEKLNPTPHLGYRHHLTGAHDFVCKHRVHRPEGMSYSQYIHRVNQELPPQDAAWVVKEIKKLRYKDSLRQGSFDWKKEYKGDLERLRREIAKTRKDINIKGEERVFVSRLGVKDMSLWVLRFPRGHRYNYEFQVTCGWFFMKRTYLIRFEYSY